MDTRELSARVAEIGWYHTIDLAPGVTTPGYFDLRDAAARLPWPDLAGRRCLDVGSFDGFYAFEMERRGASEVVAVDLKDRSDLDWLPRGVPAGLQRGFEPTAEGFRLVREWKSSKVERVACNVYDLDPDELGTFDVVLCGALLQHLRDPMGALMAIRGVCTGEFLSVEQVSTWLSLAHRRRPVARLVGNKRTWTLVNVPGHARMIHMAGFDVAQQEVVPMPFGRAGREIWGESLRRPRGRLRRSMNRMVGPSMDQPASAVLARPAEDLNPLPQ